MHHVIRSDELRNEVCLYCGSEQEGEWNSEWHGLFHYKVWKCSECNSRHLREVDFHGSGHDSFGLEERIRAA
ncbi:hypothetical protein J4439_08500 [Candidatus Woesearchaeota archaeon]|nr:hypothetical protein [Candidatus Woesearchaeota archaeon]